MQNHDNNQRAPLHTQIPLPGLYRTGCYLLAGAAMAYLSTALYPHLKADIAGSLPDIGLWIVGLFFSVMILANGKTHQLLNIVPLIGLAGLVLIF